MFSASGKSSSKLPEYNANKDRNSKKNTGGGGGGLLQEMMSTSASSTSSSQALLTAQEQRNSGQRVSDARKTESSIAQVCDAVADEYC